jgi:SAM-dependent methyltransferase
MHKSLLTILREPGTGACLDLAVARESNDRVSEGQLTSQLNGRRYPIVDGIPRFAPPENYTGSFGMQWNRFREVQIDSENGKTYSRDRFDAEAGWGEDELRGRWVLDAGCGAGRFAEIAAARGARLVALDYSSAVDAAARTLDRFDNIDIVQGSLLEPPFAPGTFDFAYCIGVVQHTPDPPKVIANVAGLVKEGGKFCFTIYGRKPWTKFNGKYLLRPLTKRLRAPTLLRAVEYVMPIAFPLTDALFRLPLIGRAMQFALPVANYVSVIHDRDLRYDTAILDTFDALSPQYDDPMTAAEVQKALRDGGATRFEFRSRVPVVVVGER